ncbi:ABC transporter permease [Devosia sp. 1566]|uniref:ABC transporter permease n=1 Tax=Devosia sp. 1566 TaxID=2499144 RepID=UPI000FD7CCB6|nr:ABC transporter permease [Devosia sp. 1566]
MPNSTAAATPLVKIERIKTPKLQIDGLMRVLLLALVAGLYVFLLVPILIVVFTSFSPDMRNSYPIGEASLRWYSAFLDNRNFVSAFQFSLGLALVASVIATAIGFVTSYGLIRFTSKRRSSLQSLAMLPMMVPHILISLALLLLLTRFPLPEMVALVIGHVLICLPFTIAGITASLEGVDSDLEAAAHTLGATRWRVLWEVTIPLIAPGVLSACIFAFIISFGDVYVALFIAGPGATTLPIEIYNFVQWESSPVIAAITTVQIVMIVLFGLLIERLVGLRSIMRM